MLNRKFNIFLFCSVLFMVSCEKDYFQTTPQIDLSKPVSFAAVIQPILNEDCATAGCHREGIQAPDLLEGKAYDQLMQLGYVDTTNAEASILYKRLIATSKPMPPSGKLSAVEISYVLAWIKQGAQNN
nr:hypothetical protein [Bacteroidota bacterium]